MPKLSLRRGVLSGFQGDVVVVPSDVDLTYQKANGAVRAVLEGGGPNLLKELSAIGYGEVGNAVITKGYSLKAKHAIFLPYTDRNNGESKLNLVLLHQALRNAFNLARLYEAKTLAIDLAPLRARRRTLMQRVLSKVMEIGPSEEGLTTDEIIDVVTGVAEEYKKTLKEIVIYR